MQYAYCALLLTFFTFLLDAVTMRIRVLEMIRNQSILQHFIAYEDLHKKASKVDKDQAEYILNGFNAIDSSKMIAVESVPVSTLNMDKAFIALVLEMCEQVKDKKLANPMKFFATYRQLQNTCAQDNLAAVLAETFPFDDQILLNRFSHLFNDRDIRHADELRMFLHSITSAMSFKAIVLLTRELNSTSNSQYFASIQAIRPFNMTVTFFLKRLYRLFSELETKALELQSHIHDSENQNLLNNFVLGIRHIRDFYFQLPHLRQNLSENYKKKNILKEAAQIRHTSRRRLTDDQKIIAEFLNKLKHSLPQATVDDKLLSWGPDIFILHYIFTHPHIANVQLIAGIGHTDRIIQFLANEGFSLLYDSSVKINNKGQKITVNNDKFPLNSDMAVPLEVHDFESAQSVLLLPAGRYNISSVH